MIKIKQKMILTSAGCSTQGEEEEELQYDTMNEDMNANYIARQSIYSTNQWHSLVIIHKVFIMKVVQPSFSIMKACLKMFPTSINYANDSPTFHLNTSWNCPHS